MTIETVKCYQAHRFRDALALSIDHFPTIYLSPAAVQLLRKDLEDFEKDLKKPFIESTFGIRGVAVGVTA